MTSFNEVVTTFLLIRHGSTELVGKALAGRTARRLLRRELGAIKHSNSQTGLRTRRSRRSIAVRCERAVEPRSRWRRGLGIQLYRFEKRLTEIDFGAWQGKTLAELEGDDALETIQHAP